MQTIMLHVIDLLLVILVVIWFLMAIDIFVWATFGHDDYFGGEEVKDYLEGILYVLMMINFLITWILLKWF